MLRQCLIFKVNKNWWWSLCKKTSTAAWKVEQPRLTSLAMVLVPATLAKISVDGGLFAGYRPRDGTRANVSAFIINHSTPTSYVIHRNGFRVRPIAEVIEKCLLHLKYGYFSYKNAWIRYRRPLFTPPEPCKAHFIMDARALINMFWTVEQKHPPTAMIELRSVRTIFNITPIGFVWKKKVIYTQVEVCYLTRARRVPKYFRVSGQVRVNV